MAASYAWLPAGGLDWRQDIGPAARHWFPTPWLEGLPLAPWAALVLSPLGALPDRLATAALNGASVVALALAIRGLGGRDWLAIPLLVSPFGFAMFYNGQTDALVLCGVLLMNGFDLLVLAMKPQVALGVMVSRIRRAGRAWPAYLAPLLVAGAVSLII